MGEGQLNLFDMMPEQVEPAVSGSLQIVKAQLVETKRANWKELFEGYDELYGITFSSGIRFMEKVMDEFTHVEMIFGCEGVLSDDVAALMSMEVKSVEQLAKSKSAVRMAERMKNESMKLYVSRDTRSHEKIFLLRAADGRCRVITGSANLSASAFCGIQRENIVCFDDSEAFDHYMDRFLSFREQCADEVSYQAMIHTHEDPNHIREDIEELPIIQTIKQNSMVILDPASNPEDEIQIVADIKGLESEMKPLLPKQKKEQGKIILSGEYTKAFRRKYKEHIEVKKIKEKSLPKLHIDYDLEKLLFNGKEMDLCPKQEQIHSDIQCLFGYLGSLSSFYGDWEQSQKDYYAFLNWYFASLFMPYLRYNGAKNGYGVRPFPVYGMLYGDSNGGKSSFIKLLSKLMCGAEVPLNSSGDFTSGNIERLKRACEGLPINIDDLAKVQYDAHYEKVVKEDKWGIEEAFLHYPAVSISTNKVPSIKSDIAKRMVSCFIGIRIDKEVGAKNEKRINDSMRQATTALYCEYVRRMLPHVMEMVEEMKKGDQSYFPDIFRASSLVLFDIFREYADEIPGYVSVLEYADILGENAVGKNAMKKVIAAWESDRKNFRIDRKRNTLTYTYEDSSRTYELRYIQQELPPILNARVIGSGIVMDLDKARELLDVAKRKIGLG